MSTEMTKIERLQAALKGQAVDRTPISFWHHYPKIDQTVDGLVKATCAFQKKYDLDFIKLMPPGTYSVIDYGAKIELKKGDIGTTLVVQTPISSKESWTRLPSLNVYEGEFERQLQVVRQVRNVLGEQVPIIQTIFSPLTIANKLAGDLFLEHVRDAEEYLREGLIKFTKDCIAFGLACLDAGVNGFFFASQHACKESGLPEGAFERLGVYYDLQILEKYIEDERNWFTILHLHGQDPLFDLSDRYPVHAVNWHDRDTVPSIRQALDKTEKALVAGIARKGAIAIGDQASAVSEVLDAINQANGRRLIVAPGCVMPYTVPEETLLAVRNTVYR